MVGVVVMVSDDFRGSHDDVHSDLETHETAASFAHVSATSWF